jgi:hypothetical protein
MAAFRAHREPGAFSGADHHLGAQEVLVPTIFRKWWPN